MIRFACPACNKVYKAGDELAGRKTACKQCGAVVIIPEQPVREVLYGTALPPEDFVEPTPEPEPESTPRAKPTSYRGEDDRYSGGEDEPDDGWAPSRQSVRRPGKVSAVAGMLIAGGAWAIFGNLLSIVIFPLWCFWPGMYFGVVWGILAVIRGAALLGDRWYRHEPRTLVLLQIGQAVNLDIINIPLGIVGMVFLNERHVGGSFRRRGW